MKGSLPECLLADSSVISLTREQVLVAVCLRKEKKKKNTKELKTSCIRLKKRGHSGRKAPPATKGKERSMRVRRAAAGRIRGSTLENGLSGQSLNKRSSQHDHEIPTASKATFLVFNLQLRPEPKAFEGAARV